MLTIDKKYTSLESSLIDYFEENKQDLFSGCHPVVKKQREEAFNYFRKSGLPGNRDEKWRNSLLPKQYDQTYTIEDSPVEFNKSASEIFECEIHGYSAHIVSMLNGWYYSQSKDTMMTFEDGVIVGSILTAQKEFPELFEKHYGKIADFKKNGFAAINTALFRDGIFIYVPDNVEVKNAIQLLMMVSRDDQLLMNSRNLIVMGRNSKLQFMHCDDSINHDSSFVNTLTEIYVGENSSFEMYKLQNINNETTLMNSTFIRQERDSRSKVAVLTLNGGKIRNEIDVDFRGEGAEADLNGIYLLDNSQHVDNQVFVRHSVPNCLSNELFKGVLDDEASAVFNGYIYVAKDAQKTNAFQRNNNILMTSDASIDTMPFLEIYADDVKCSHGATVGQLDEDALFYLMQRGISRHDARMLLMYAFISEVTSKVSIDPVRISIEDMVKKRLRGELSICEKCVLHCSIPDQPIEFEIDMSKI
jgi:Fe-S cluster assembly protein SufD